MPTRQPGVEVEVPQLSLGETAPYRFEGINDLPSYPPDTEAVSSTVRCTAGCGLGRVAGVLISLRLTIGEVVLALAGSKLMLDKLGIRHSAGRCSCRNEVWLH